MEKHIEEWRSGGGDEGGCKTTAPKNEAHSVLVVVLVVGDGAGGITIMVTTVLMAVTV